MIGTLFILLICPKQSYLCHPPEPRTCAEIVLHRQYRTLLPQRETRVADRLVADDVRELWAYSSHAIWELQVEGFMDTVHQREASSFWFILSTWS